MSETCVNCGHPACYGCGGEFTAETSEAGRELDKAFKGEINDDPDAVDWHPHGGYRNSAETAGNDRPDPGDDDHEPEYTDEAYEKWLESEELDFGDYDEPHDKDKYDVPF